MNTEPNKQDTQNNYTPNHDSERWRPIVVIIGWAIVILFALWNICTIAFGLEQRWNNFLPLSVNALILMAMFVQATITQRQWKAMRDGLERTDQLITQTREHFEMSERPALGIEDISPRQNADGTWTIVGQLVNRGKTAAKLIEFEVSGAMIDATDEVRNGKVPEPPPPIRSLGTSSIQINSIREVFFVTVTGVGWNNVTNGEDELLFIWMRCEYIAITHPDREPYVLEYYGCWNKGLQRFIDAPTHNEIT